MKHRELNVLAPKNISRRRLLQLAAGVTAAGFFTVATGCASAETDTGGDKSAAPGAGGGGDATTLNYFSWAGFPDAARSEFEESANVSLRITNYGSTDEMLTKLQSGGTGLYDMICPAEDTLWLLIELGLIKAMDINNLPNAKRLMPEFTKDEWWQEGNDFYYAPFVWGADAIAYNRELVDEDVTSLDVLFDSKYEGKIAMLDDPLDMLAIGGYMAGVKDPFGMTGQDLQEAKRVMIDQKPLVRAYWTAGADLQNLFANEDIAIGWSYMNSVNSLREEGMSIGWGVVPGAIGWTEGVCLLDSSTKAAEVEAYADWTLGEEYGLALAKEQNYAPTSQPAIDQLDDETKEELGIDLDAAKHLVDRKYPENIEEYNEAWAEVMRA